MSKTKKRDFWLVIALVAVVFAFVSARSSSTKIAFIDMNRALNEVEEGKKELGKLEKWKQMKTKELEKREQELMKRKEQLKKEESTLKAEVYKQKVEEYFKDVEKYQQDKLALAQELQNRLAQATIYVKKRMDLVIQEIAEKEGFDIVVDITEGGVIYFPNYLDITNEVIRLYNKRYPVKGKGKK